MAWVKMLAIKVNQHLSLGFNDEEAVDDTTIPENSNCPTYYNVKTHTVCSDTKISQHCTPFISELLHLASHS
jgi:hypothetical protein